MPRGLISIVVPVYNAERYLEALAANLTRQTVQEYEVLVVNDASRDRSGDLLQRMARADSRFRYFEHHETRGQGEARNTGLENATGDYVMYVDADDAFAPNYLERMRTVVDRDGADIAICNSIWEYPDKRERHNMFLSRPWTRHRVFTNGEALRRYYNIFESDVWIPVEPWGKIVRRSFIEKHALRHPTTLFEDVVMTFNEMLLAERVACVSDYLYYYNRSNVSAATVERQRRYIREMYHAPAGVLHVIDRYRCSEEMRTYGVLFLFRFINGVYTFFARGQTLREELSHSLEKCRDLVRAPLPKEHRTFLARQLRDFYYEMKSYGFTDLYSLFVAPYRSSMDEVLLEAIPRSGTPRKRDVLAAIRTLWDAKFQIAMHLATPWRLFR